MIYLEVALRQPISQKPKLLDASKAGYSLNGAFRDTGNGVVLELDFKTKVQRLLLVLPFNSIKTASLLHQQSKLFNLTRHCSRGSLDLLRYQLPLTKTLCQ